jgi:hypothetical protein
VTLLGVQFLEPHELPCFRDQHAHTSTLCVSRRYQIQRRPANSATATVPVGEERFSGFLDALTKIYRAHGIKGLFRGALTRVAYHTPSTALTLASYDQLKLFFGKLQK